MINFQETTRTSFKPTKALSQAHGCSHNCQTQIQKTLPFWINSQPFWTYRCLCCKVYQFDLGKIPHPWGGLYG